MLHEHCKLSPLLTKGTQGLYRKIQDPKINIKQLSPLVVACRWWWGQAVVGSHGSMQHFLSSGFPHGERCSQSVYSPVAMSAGGSQNSWVRMWGMSSSPHSSCPSPPRHGAPGGYHSCSISFSCSTSYGCHMSTLPPCAGKRNWIDSIKQCSIFPTKHRAPFSCSQCIDKNKAYDCNGKMWGFDSCPLDNNVWVSGIIVKKVYYNDYIIKRYS